MRAKMLAMLGFDIIKLAICLSDKPNSLKLWKRLLFSVVPPPISIVPFWDGGLTVVPVPVGFGSGTML